jgi:hypothetical protein
MPTDSFFFTFFLVAVVGEDFHARQELLELHFPVKNDRSRDDDEVLAPDTFIASEVSEKSDGLDGFARDFSKTLLTPQ